MPPSSPAQTTEAPRPARRPKLRERSARLRRASLAFGVVGLLCALAYSAWIYRESTQRQLAEMEASGRTLAESLDHELSLRELAVDALAAQVDDALDGRVRLGFDVAALLEPEEAHGTYRLRPPAGFAPEEIGRLTGSLPVPTDAATLREISAALSLSATMRTLRARDPEVPWVYYMSHRRFLYLYPGAGAESVHWTPALRDEFFAFRGRTLTADGPRVAWTPVYPDAAGKGPMVTVARVLVRDGALVGGLAVDYGGGQLRRLLDSHTGGAAMVAHLVGPGGEDMLPGSRALPKLEPQTLTDGGSVEIGDLDLVSFPVPRAGWRLVLTVPCDVVLAEALEESLVHGLMVLFLVAAATLLLALVRTLHETTGLAMRDGLTGLWNRRHFDEVLPRELARARRSGGTLGLILVDIDHFKALNDTYGHPHGDEVLQGIAEALGQALGVAGDSVFRIGGEEFAGVAVVADPGQVSALSDAVVASVRALCLPHAGSPAGRLTASVGAVAVGPVANFDVEATLREADAALYRAKELGRDRVELVVAGPPSPAPSVPETPAD
jgi:diguanylate cyclase (GGDEF)-like protein